MIRLKDALHDYPTDEDINQFLQLARKYYDPQSVRYSNPTVSALSNTDTLSRLSSSIRIAAATDEFVMFVSIVEEQTLWIKDAPLIEEFNAVLAHDPANNIMLTNFMDKHADQLLCEQKFYSISVHETSLDKDHLIILDNTLVADCDQNLKSMVLGTIYGTVYQNSLDDARKRYDAYRLVQDTNENDLIVPLEYLEKSENNNEADS